MSNSNIRDKKNVPTNAEQSINNSVNPDEAFSVLSNARRQHVIGHVAERLAIGNQSEIDLGDLAEDIAAAELDKPLTEVDSDERKRVYVSLYQSHMPKLVEVGVVDHASEIETGTEFVPGPNAELFASLLGGAQEVIHESNHRSTDSDGIDGGDFSAWIVSQLASVLGGWR